MLVGTATLDYKVIREFAGDPASLCVYAESLVPLWARHIPQLVLNQRYFVAIHVRNMLQIPFPQRKEMYDALIEGCAIHGVVNEFVPIQQVFDICDVSTLVKLIRRDLDNEKD